MKIDLEAIDLKLAAILLSLRAIRGYKEPRNKEGQFRNQDNTGKHENNEDTSSKAMLAIDGVDFDWSDMVEEQVQTNMALMAFSDSKFLKGKSSSLIKIRINVLKRVMMFVPPPSSFNLYNRPKKLDLSYSGLDKFKDPEFKSYGSKDNQVSEDTSSFVESPLNVDKETVFLADKKRISRNLMEVMLHLGEEHMVVDLLILLKIHRKDNMYSFDMKNIVPKESLTCLVANATLDESML
ncbi:hypothetical protein Tco_0271598 [Tanacetum coccineum]